MSRRRDNYENSRWRKFERWLEGEVDPLSAGGIETVVPDSSSAQNQAGTGLSGGAAQDLAQAYLQNLAAKAERPDSDFNGYMETEPRESGQMAIQLKEDGQTEPELWKVEETDQKRQKEREERGIRIYRRFYQIMSVLLCLGIILVLLWTIAYLPIFGNAGNPDNNEVSARYIEQGLKETGAVNIVTGMILDYRAFDTFGESCVLFIASCCVLVLLRTDHHSQEETDSSLSDRMYEPKNDMILQKCACVLVPVILVFGIYMILNGHLSPGGGFSGGAVLGSGLILYLNAFGFAKTERFFNAKVYRRVTVSALTFYCLAKSYSFFTGANHLESGIPLGTPGAIISSGLILPLNICVGLVVACTMYAFYTLFRKGGM